ncbi:juvenile hormone epoxide hydrolase 2-like [Cylas formicarius]|uniref:juvenile hormone epoxide hydrolase 2-like n=1 Tax=Cylas formicarius TaxID=197179 RepID=UPI0029584178|nr:juvenile hormone epoxide hydrolase 2-like [Cylas formicarius]
MSNIRYVSLLVLTTIFGILCYGIVKLVSPPQLPKIEENSWWGPGKAVEESDAVRRFTIKIPKKDIIDLQWRLENHRPLTPPLENVHHQYGINTNLVNELVRYWRTKYNWTEREAFLNRYPQYKTKIHGLDVHFIHVKRDNAGNKTVLPLLLLHGWPGSVREFYEAFPLLTEATNRSFVLEVVAPHIPGYGFSQAASKPGLGVPQVAVILRKLMHRLGHKKFYCQGGDMGGIILQTLSVLYPDSVLGFHSNMVLIYTVKGHLYPFLSAINPSWVVKEHHYDRVYPLIDKALFILQESAYLHLQATKPDSLGVAMTDSPVGLAAYILEKFVTGSNFTWIHHGGNLLEKFSFDELIDNIMIYWLTSTATSSFRLYAESFTKMAFYNILRNPVKVPSSIARYRYDLYSPDGILSEIYPNLVQLTDHDGGHFAAFENPSVFSNDVLSAIEKFETFHNCK